MGSILTSACSHILLDRAVLLPEDRELASHWASEYINGNPAYRWVIGKFVEADRPNSNMQMWRLNDLKESQSTIDYSPMNILHHPQHVVGTFVGTEMMYPSGSSDEAQEQQLQPYIEAAGAFWRYYYPQELAVIEKAHAEGSLFFSMECVAETMTFVDPAGEEKSFDYVGPMSDTYGEWGKSQANIRRLDGPHFLGGALIFPPKRPGWKGANIQELSEIVAANEEEAAAAYDTFAEGAPHLDPSIWEELMLHVLAQAKGFSE